MLAQKAIDDAKKKQEEERLAAEAAAALATQKEGRQNGPVSAPTTPVAAPGTVRAGVYEKHCPSILKLPLGPFFCEIVVTCEGGLSIKPIDDQIHKLAPN